MVMSVSSSRPAGRPAKTVRENTIEKGKQGLVIGAALGAVEGFTRKSWLSTKGEPSDSFVKNVSKEMQKALKPEEQSEVTKVNKFFEALLDYRTEPSELRERIEKSKELSNAVIKKEGETTQTALDRIFAQDKPLLKQELRDLQNRTTIDKKVDLHAAKQLVKTNFDASAKKFKRSADTSKEMFSVIKKSMQNVRLKRTGRDTIIGGILLGITGMLVGATQHNSKSKKA